MRVAAYEASELVHDWNQVAEHGSALPVTLLDETLRDGLQNPSVRVPPVELKLELLELMAHNGISHATIGLPAASKRAFAECLALCRGAAKLRLPLSLACAARTLPRDIEPVVELSQRAGVALGVNVFVGTSPIRAFCENWDLLLIRQRTEAALDAAVRHGLAATYVTEDTSRSRPDVLAELFRVAIDRGASRLCLCDTVGHATPHGARALVTFTRDVITECGAPVGIDWHGHNDRGLALANALAALEAGADRIHGTALGIGERVGNAPMELVILNLSLAGALPGQDLGKLTAYSRLAAHALGCEIPPSYPLLGRDAFRTATGVHAAAIIKARSCGSDWLADRVYSSVPAATFGRSQEICVGHMSGSSNVVHWLTSHGYEASEPLVRTVLERAKQSDHILTDDELTTLAELFFHAETPPARIP